MAAHFEGQYLHISLLSAGQLDLTKKIHYGSEHHPVSPAWTLIFWLATEKNQLSFYPLLHSSQNLSIYKPPPRSAWKGNFAIKSVFIDATWSEYKDLQLNHTPC